MSTTKARAPRRPLEVRRQPARIPARGWVIILGWLGWVVFALHWRPLTVPHLVWDSFAACPALVLSSVVVSVCPAWLRITDPDRCSGTAAEQVVAQMLCRTGWTDVQVVGGPGDAAAKAFGPRPRPSSHHRAL